MDLTRPFFSGIAGTGMSALAQYLAFQGIPVSGSDRSLDRGAEAKKREYFQSIGVALKPQDGTGPEGCSCLVVSTAIEAQNPEIQTARRLGLPILHRSDVLAELARRKRTIAVSGTSGKSTVTGMIYHVLAAGGLQPSLITGANLNSLQSQGLLGNAVGGTGEWLAIEADESDGSLIKYAPQIALILNIEKDHKEIAELIPLFRQFRDQTQGSVILNHADSHCRELHRDQDSWFWPDGIGFKPDEVGLRPDGISKGGAEGGSKSGARAVAEVRAENIRLGDWETNFVLAGVAFCVPVPGRHNLANAIAAIAVGRALEIPLERCAEGIAAYRGVERRHVLVGVAGGSVSTRTGAADGQGLANVADAQGNLQDTVGVTVVDDFAHNPAKVQACLETVKHASDGKPRRVLAVFHPHGFAPMKLMRRELTAAIAAALGPEDHLFMPEIYYAGGTADKSISSADLIDDLNALGGPQGHFFPTKDAVIEAISRIAKPGDWVVTMGARDPGLGDFAQGLFQALLQRFE